MKFLELNGGELIRLIPMDSPKYWLHYIPPREHDSMPAHHLLNVLDVQSNEVRTLRIKSSAMKPILEVYRDQMISQRLHVSQRAQARRFKMSKMKYRTPSKST